MSFGVSPHGDLVSDLVHKDVRKNHTHQLKRGKFNIIKKESVSIKPCVNNNMYIINVLAEV